MLFRHTLADTSLYIYLQQNAVDITHAIFDLFKSAMTSQLCFTCFIILIPKSRELSKSSSFPTADNRGV